MPTEPSTSTSGGSDWPTQATETIVGLVDSVKDKTTGPATTIARAVVYGTLAAIVATAALVLFLVVLVRGFDILAQIVLDAIGIEKAGRSVWIAHLITGLLFLGPGLLAWRRGIRPVAD